MLRLLVYRDPLERVHVRERNDNALVGLLACQKRAQNQSIIREQSESWWYPWMSGNREGN